MSKKTILHPLLPVVTAAVLLITGCKLEITVPDGGRVASKSGAYECQAGNVCTIDIYDLFFDEEFVAIPALDYGFVEWRKVKRGLCSHKRTPCRIMSGWAQIDELFIALLESDEVFNLEPVFGPATSGTMFSGLTSQKLPIALTFQANRITRLEFTYQQLGEIPPNPQCRHEISVDLSVPVATDGTFDADISVPPTVSDSGKLQVVVFEGRLKGTLGDFLATADWDFTELEVVCETSNGRIRRNFCGANFFSCLDAVDFSFELERNVGDF